MSDNLVEISIFTLTNNKFTTRVSATTTVREVRDMCAQHFRRDRTYFFISKSTGGKSIIPDNEYILNHGITFRYFSDRNYAYSHQNQQTQSNQMPLNQPPPPQVRQEPLNQLPQPQIRQEPLNIPLTSQIRQDPLIQTQPQNPEEINSSPSKQSDLQNQGQLDEISLQKFLSTKKLDRNQEAVFKRYFKIKQSILLHELYSSFEKAGFNENKFCNEMNQEIEENLHNLNFFSKSKDDYDKNEDEEKDDQKILNFLSNMDISQRKKNLFLKYHKMRPNINLQVLYFFFEASGYDEESFKKLLDEQ